MPLVRENDNVRVKYTIPENIKTLITDDFLKEFRNQLFRIHEYYSLDTFAESGIPINTSTSGWFAALGKACLLTNKNELFDYWRSLPWYDSDIFDGELANMLIEKRFILGNLSDVIKKELGIGLHELRECNDCGRLYTKDMVIEIDDVDENELFSKYRCQYCQDVKNTADGNKNATDYYRSVLDELDEYAKKRPVNNIE